MDIPQLEEIDHPGTMWVDLNAHLTQLILKVGFMAVLGHTITAAKIAMVGIVFDLASVADLVHRRLHPRRRRPRPKPEFVKDFTSIEVETEVERHRRGRGQRCAAEIAAGHYAPHSPQRAEGLEMEKEYIVQRIRAGAAQEDILADKLGPFELRHRGGRGHQRAPAQAEAPLVRAALTIFCDRRNVGRAGRAGMGGSRRADLGRPRRRGGGGEALADDEGTGEEKGAEPDDVVVVPGSGALSEDDAGFNEALLAAKVGPPRRHLKCRSRRGRRLVNEALLAAKVRGWRASPKPAWQVDTCRNLPVCRWHVISRR